MTALGKLADLVFCNMLFCLLALPILPLGAALSALYDCTLCIAEDREEGPFIGLRFWRALRRNWKQASLLWLLCLGAFLLLGAYAWAVSTLGGALGQVYRVTFLLLCFGFLAGYQYIFPLQARYEMKTGQLLKNAWLLSLAALPWTLLSLLVTAGAVYLSFFMNPAALNTFIFLWAVAVVAVIAYVNSFFFLRAFRKLPQGEGDAGEG